MEKHTCALCEVEINKPPSGVACLCKRCNDKAIEEIVDSKYALDKYARKLLPMITQEMYSVEWNIEKGFVSKEGKPIKCKTCGGNSILELEVKQRTREGASLVDYMKKGRDAFIESLTEEVDSTEFRCSDCDSLEAMIIYEISNNLKIFW